MADSVQVTPLIVRKQSGLLLGLPWWQIAIFFLLVAWLYASILAGLFGQWMHDPNFQHGFIVPLFALFVLWQDRQKLQSVKLTPSWTGIPIILFAVIVLVLGVLGAELFLSRVSLLILLAGLIIALRGWPLFRAVLFPWAFLISDDSHSGNHPAERDVPFADPGFEVGYRSIERDSRSSVA